MLVNAGGRQFEKAPTGTYSAVFADYVDLGDVKVVFKGKEKIQKKVRLVWILDAKDKNGEYYQVIQQVSQSMFHKGTQKARLYDIVQSVLLGKDPMGNGAKAFEMEELIGRNNEIFIQQEESNGTIYANIKAIMPPKAKFAVPASFVRAKDRDTSSTQNVGNSTQASAAPVASEVADEDIPF